MGRGKIWVNNHAHIIEETAGVSFFDICFHYIQTIDVTPFNSWQYTKIDRWRFQSITDPVPPLPVQSEIVRTLDNFTELPPPPFTAELTAELTARKKQYEFYPV